MSVSFDHLKEFVTAELAHRKAQPAGVLSPSDYWLDYNRFSSYVRTLPDHELKSIRHHTWHLTGDIYTSYHFISNRLRRQVLAEYQALLPALGGFKPAEPEAGIGLQTEHGLINSGILRYSLVLGDLHGHGFLPRTGAKRILEIGGGYGGLALMCQQFNPEISYVICDLEETIFFQGVFLTLHLGPERVHLVRGENGDLENLQPGHVYLLPQTRVAALEKLRFDLALNQQSMQEMTRPQVERYCDVLEKCADRFYSCNRKSHGAGVVESKGLVADLHNFLASRFRVVWDSTEHISSLARVCLRHKLVRKVVCTFIGKSFLPKGEALLLRYVYHCRKPVA